MLDAIRDSRNVDCCRIAKFSAIAQQIRTRTRSLRRERFSWSLADGNRDLACRCNKFFIRLATADFPLSALSNSRANLRTNKEQIAEKVNKEHGRLGLYPRPPNLPYPPLAPLTLRGSQPEGTRVSACGSPPAPGKLLGTTKRRAGNPPLPCCGGAARTAALWLATGGCHDPQDPPPQRAAVLLRSRASVADPIRPKRA